MTSAYYGFTSYTWHYRTHVQRYSQKFVIEGGAAVHVLDLAINFDLSGSSVG